MVDGTCVVVATEIAGGWIADTLLFHRPGIEVVQSEPDAVDAAVVHLRPCLVIYDAASEIVETRVPVWLLLPQRENVGILSILGTRRTIARPGLADLLAAVDTATRLDETTANTPFG